MRSWSFSLGRVLGVEVRIHSFFVVLLGFCISFGMYASGSGGRGFVLWLMLLGAVAVRETARALAAACLGLELRSLLLLPTGGLSTFGSGAANEEGEGKTVSGRDSMWIAIVGPVANLVFAGVLAGLTLSVSPEIELYRRPWVEPGHLLKALVWVNLLLSAVNLLPASPLDGKVLFGMKDAAPRGRRPLLTYGQMIAVGLVIVGTTTGSVWFIMMGFFVLFGAQMEDQGMTLQTQVDTITMREVMLTDYTTLSASDTLEDALERAVHTLQDVFPVVRGGTIVGAVSRQSIVEALRTGGNSYVQGVMARTFEVARPGDALVKTLHRIAGTGGAQFVPVLEGEQVVGIVTPNHLSQAIRLRGHLPKRGRERDER